MSNPAPTINQINAFNVTQGTTIDFNIIGGTELVRSNRIYIYDLSDNSLICTHLYVSTESIHELPANTDSSIVYESGKSSADFINGAQYYAQIQTFTDTAGTQGGSGLSVAKMFWCLDDPTLTIDTIPSTISTTSYNVSATYNANTSVVSNIIQQYQFSLYSATGSLLQSSGVVVGNGEQQGTSTVYDISYNFTGLSVGSSYYVAVEVATTQGMSVSAQSGTFTVSIDTPTLGEATVVNNACDGYISVTSNLSGEYGGHVSGEMASFETDSVNNVSSLKVNMEPIQEGSGIPSPTNIRPIRGHSGVNAYVSPTQSADDGTKYSQAFDVSLTPTSTDKVPYTFKAVGQDVYGDRETDMLVGGTVAWNQLAPILNSTNWTSESGVAATYSDGVATISSTVARNGIYFRRNIIANHKYLVTCELKSESAVIVLCGSSIGLYAQASLSGGEGWKRASAIQYRPADQTSFPLFVYGTTANYNIQAKNFMLIDLTAMFGSTIADYIYSLEQSQAGAGVAWFRSYFPKDYYPYDPGTLRSVEGVSAHETVGFNQWDEEWEQGGINQTTGANTSNANAIRSKNYIRVVSNATYYVKAPIAVRGYWYDADKNYINTESLGVNTTFTVPSGACYLRFIVGNSTTPITAYGNNICINLSWDGERDGEYEAYVKHSYPLDDSLTLRGIPKLDSSNNLYYDGDTYEDDGAVTRKYGIVDLGTLNWDYSKNYNRHSSNIGNVLDMKLPTADIIPNVIISVGKYKIASSNDGYANRATQTAFAIDSTGYIRMYNDGTADGTAYKTAMSGVYLVYELATPTTETADPYANPQIVDNWGTEAYVTTGIVPVGHDTEYLTRDVFSGTLDLVTGVLTVDRAMVDLGTLNWSKFDASSDAVGTQSIYATTGLNKLNATSAIGVITMVSNKYLGVGNVTSNTAAWQRGNMTVCSLIGNGDRRVYIRDDSLINETAADFKTAMNGVQLVYELTTPQTYQLTPHQIQTLVGQNNVWSEQGDVELSYHIPITNLLVKRQDVGDVSGDWLTLYSQPITQASDMDFTFIDFLNQHGKTYKYALVPLLTQTQSGVIVEIEGGYTVSDNVNSIFDGVYIADQTNVERVKAGAGYGNIDMNQGVGSITPIGSKYPIVITNSQNQYHNGSIRGTIVPNDFYSNGNLSRIDMVNKRDELEQFLTNKRAKIIKDWNGKMWLVMIMSNVACSFDDNYGMGMVSFSADWLEVGDPTSQQDLYNAGLVDVGGV